ncbi:DUF6804 family protein [Bradyrhizobium sp. BR 1433]|uniref:DUF6804 family protein n=1 Tax=Bradyrhizobium sp. BR 1433 TaxID=3447967 RepID=UPI003EE6F488
MPKILWPVAVALLLFAILKLPYGYYTFLRVAIFGFCGVVAALSFLEKTSFWGLAFLLLALLFNPVFPVYLQRQTWFWLDLGAAIVIATHFGWLHLVGKGKLRTPAA